MVKPERLRKGDTVAAFSPSLGGAGSPEQHRKYVQGCRRLEALGLRVVAAPNSLREADWLENHPEARAEDLLWAFANTEVKAIIANIGGNDSHRLFPYLDPAVIRGNPKILCGYSDVMSLHLFCHRLGLTTFYGDNLLTTVAENGAWHPYSRRWFEKVFFDPSPIGVIPPAEEWSFDENDLTDTDACKRYVPNPGYGLVQGSGVVRGRLFGGHGDLRTLCLPDGSPLASEGDFRDAILFFEDIPELCDVEYMGAFFDWLGRMGHLRLLRGVVIGKMRQEGSFAPYAARIREIVGGKYGRPELPILCDLNFGHSSPICILPYGAEAEIDAEARTFRIPESGVL